MQCVYRKRSDCFLLPGNLQGAINLQAKERGMLLVNVIGIFMLNEIKMLEALGTSVIHYSPRAGRPYPVSPNTLTDNIGAISNQPTALPTHQNSYRPGQGVNPSTPWQYDRLGHLCHPSLSAFSTNPHLRNNEVSDSSLTLDQERMQEYCNNPSAQASVMYAAFESKGYYLYIGSSDPLYC